MSNGSGLRSTRLTMKSYLHACPHIGRELHGLRVGYALFGEAGGQRGDQILEGAPSRVAEQTGGGRGLDHDGSHRAPLAVAAGHQVVAFAAHEDLDQLCGAGGGGSRAVDLCDAVGCVQQGDLGGEFLLATGEVKVDRPAWGAALSVTTSDRAVPR